jgi:hypothetical protein
LLERRARKMFRLGRALLKLVGFYIIAV